VIDSSRPGWISHGRVGGQTPATAAITQEGPERAPANVRPDQPRSCLCLTTF
jgi:hypothetical protein